jgi:hypothetical protein
MKINFAIFIALCFAFSISSCSNKNGEGRHIPSSATVAVHVNVKTLSGKLPWNEIKKHSSFANAYNTDSTWIKNFLDSPATSGIDIGKGIFMFAQSEKNSGYIAIEGSIKDEAAFKTFCSRMSASSEIKEEDGVQYISRYPDCVGWNSTQFIYIIDAPEMQRMDELNRRMQQDSIDITDHTPRNLQATCKQLFELDAKKSLATNDKFSSLLKEEGDLHIWANTELFYKDAQPKNALSLINLEKFYIESVTTAVVNFENGSIKINAHSYSNAALAKVYEKFAGGKLKEEMLKKIPGDNVVAALAINFKPEVLLAIAKVINVDGIINSYAPTLSFTFNDFIKANKGDIVVGVADFKMMPDSNTESLEFLSYPVYKPSFNAVFAASVADKSAFDKLYNAGGKASSMLLNTQSYPLFNAYSNDYFVLGNSKASADAFINSTTDKNRDFISKIQGSPVGGYVNLQSLIKGFGQKDSTKGKAIYDASLQLWDNVVLTGGNFANGALNYTLEINLIDKTTNSLQQLNKYAAIISEAQEQEKKKELEDMRTLQDAFPSEVIPKNK